DYCCMIWHNNAYIF
nr:immunoglobulin light chain junction region [Macaca mulatta]MOX78071.1 immunoglobulin light chain junction region [Macaca mulatta]MOX78875.1 immunoglobulin light chain junction region [Macaca mulatta]MOX79308.1 immunoglobulin light chain junction region [Macaca mulatta]MOX79605.1 immunoglobulin light chain junction region [Macaca mulatta]